MLLSVHVLIGASNTRPDTPSLVVFIAWAAFYFTRFT